MIGISQFAYATNAAPEMTLDEVNSKIASIEATIDGHDANMDSAHDMAEAARALGLTEEDAIILRAKDIYSENSDAKVELKAELDRLGLIKSDLEAKAAEEAAKKVYVGNFKLTAYCPCYSCSEGYGTNTASGAKATEGITVAADRNILPLGTRIYIEGVGERIVQDVGGAVKNKKIDIYVDSHGECYNSAYNQSSASVYILND